MKTIAILPLALLFLSAGVVRSQAPVTAADVTTSLQTLITANKDLIATQQRTLDGLDQLDQTAQELKAFVKRD